jgi:hypothetical protein
MHVQQPKQHLRAKAPCVQLLGNLVSTKTALATAATAMTATTLLIQHNFIRSMQVNSEQLRRAFKDPETKLKTQRRSLKKRKNKIKGDEKGRRMVRKPKSAMRVLVACQCVLHGSALIDVMH